jgi:dienelactone hydrolase
MLAVAGVAYALSARADCPKKYTVETYFQRKDLPDKPNSRCDVKNGKCVKIQLTGRLYRPDPSTKGPHPILIMNHGSGQPVNPDCEMGQYFSQRGYLVFIPSRRGHEGSTGAYFDQYTSTYCQKKGDDGFCKMAYLHEQVDDVKEAIEFARKQPGVDKDQVALIGHSFGGIVTLFSNQKDLGQRAVVDVAGGSQSWPRPQENSAGNPDAVRELEQAVRDAVAPIFFFEPMNDRSIDPTIHLARIAGHNCKQFQAALYPAIDVSGDGDKPDGKITGADYASPDIRDRAHTGTMSQPEVWGPAVEEFLARYLKGTVRFGEMCKGTSHQEQ